MAAKSSAILFCIFIIPTFWSFNHYPVHLAGKRVNAQAKLCVKSCLQPNNASQSSTTATFARSDVRNEPSEQCKTVTSVAICMSSCRRHPLTRYFTYAFTRIQDQTCNPKNKFNANNRHPNFNKRLKLCALLIADANRIYKNGNICVNPMYKQKTGQELCDIIADCVGYVYSVCNREVSSFLMPSIVLQFALAEIYHNSTILPPKE
ncbi:hypothetical protein DdX_06289 [Ditylenchus destructor]|uniref:Uncharacterized protein n=1 Tax=Ditylenchus destructor TaxID=166010 RepID=A0AAD4NCF3_9BILA|nr:hypothetical protein DdX_06289 [Ditylenchus destructor]